MCFEHGILTEFLISWKPPLILTKMKPVVCEAGTVTRKNFENLLPNRKKEDKLKQNFDENDSVCVCVCFSLLAFLIIYSTSIVYES